MNDTVNKIMPHIRELEQQLDDELRACDGNSLATLR